MHIDSYRFGKTVVDGTGYSSDCLILGDSVRANWWRKQGHLLAEKGENVAAALHLTC